MQDRPMCFKCGEQIEHSPIYEAPCGHDKCRSACFHGVCLMEWREFRQEIEKKMREIWKQWIERHTENERSSE
jgi:hypothetical protein